MEKAADGVWHVRGGSHKMKEHVFLVGAPLGDGRTKAVLREVRKTIPGKPIHTVLSTHLHFDHSDGLRAAASEGILIATFRDNVKFFKAAYGGKDSIKPDAHATSGKGLNLLLLETNTSLQTLAVGGNAPFGRQCPQ